MEIKTVINLAVNATRAFNFFRQKKQEEEQRQRKKLAMKTKIAILLLVVVALVCAVVFIPSVNAFASNVYHTLVNDEGEVQPITLKLGGVVNLTLDVNLQLPKFEFNPVELELPTISLNVYLILIAVLLVFISTFSRIVSVLSTLLFSGIALHFSAQTVNVYNAMLANGSTTWEAAKTCFGAVLLIYLVVLANGLFGFSGSLCRAKHTENIFRKLGALLFSIFLALFFAAIAAAILAGLVFVTLGLLGWAVGIYVVFAVAFIIACIGEYLNKVTYDIPVADDDFI